MLCHCRLFPESHLDVSGGANISTNVAADALVIVGIDITTGGRFGLRYFEYGSLWAIHDTVIALEALTTTHAALGFGDGLSLDQRLQPLVEVAQRFLGGQ